MIQFIKDAMEFVKELLQYTSVKFTISQVKRLVAYLTDVIKKQSMGFYFFATVLLFMAMAGGFNWYLYLTHGAGLTGSNDFVPWGLFLVGFIFFVGTSAGVTIIGLLIHGFGREEYRPLAVRAILIGLVSMIAAILNLMLDAGVPFRAMLIPGVLNNPRSMLDYTSQTYGIFGVLLAAQLFFTVRALMGSKLAFDKTMAKWIAIIAVPIGLVVLQAPEGSLFAVVKAREAWHSPLLPPHFAVVSLIAGLSLMILVGILANKIQKREVVAIKTLSHLGIILAFVLSVNIVMDLFELFILYYSDVLEGIETLHILTGRFAPLFIIHIFGFIASLLMLLTKWGRTTATGLFTVSCIVTAAIIAYRWDLVVVPQIVPLLQGLPEIHYIPTASEYVVEAGVVALIVLVYSVLTRILPMEAVVRKEID